jgi:hypothetical protein
MMTRDCVNKCLVLMTPTIGHLACDKPNPSDCIGNAS